MRHIAPRRQPVAARSIMKAATRSLELLPNAVLGFVLCGALIAGCGSSPPPTERVASAEAAIRGAQEVGAANVPAAALSVKLAQEEVQKAKQLMQDGDNRRAALILMRAQADAELSLAQARESQAQAEAQQAVDQVKALRGK